MDIETTNSPGAEGSGVSAETNPLAGVGEQQDQVLAEQSDSDPAEIETEEVEHDGKKYAIPKAIKPLLMFQGDYTRKTQEHAEAVKARDAEFAAREQALVRQAQVQATLVGEYARIATVDQQIAPYANVNWQAAMAENPQAAQAAWMQYQQLKEQRAGLVNRAQQLEHERSSELERTRSERIQQEEAKVRSEISNWSPDLAAALLKTGRDVYGFSAGHLSQIDDARIVRLLHDAHQYQQLKKSAAAASKQPASAGASQPAAQAAAPMPQPAATLPGAGSASVKTIDDPRLSTEEWMRRRQTQLEKRGRR